MKNQLFKCSVRAYYDDTDAAGVVYHARYLAFYERARAEMLRECGFSQGEILREQQVAFAVRRATIDYLAPARLDDLLEVTTKLVSYRRTSLVFEQNISIQSSYIQNSYVQNGHAQNICDTEAKPISQAEVVIVCVDPVTMKPIALPSSIAAEFL